MNVELKQLWRRLLATALSIPATIVTALLLTCLLPGVLSGISSGILPANTSGIDKINLADAAWAKGFAKERRIRGSGLPVPRYVSLKSDRINIRKGPGLDHRILWVFRRAGLPVEVVKEFNGWRQIRDAEGSVGWVLGAMLSGRRTALVLPWEVKSTGRRKHVKLHGKAATNAPAVAELEAGVLANISGCADKWCEVTISGLRGYIEQKNLWGVYPAELVK